MDKESVPIGCRQRAMREGKPYMRSSCAVCGKFSPRWRECDAALGFAPASPTPGPPSSDRRHHLSEDDVRRIVREELAKEPPK